MKQKFADTLKNYGLILVVIAIAFYVRVCGIGYGLYHPDEPIVVNRALSYASGDLNPHFFKIPPLTSYLLAVVYAKSFILAKISGCIPSVAAFEKLFFTQPEFFYTLGRFFMGVIPGVMTVFFLYLLVKKYFERNLALLAALFLCLNFLHVRDSHFIYADMFMVLFVMLGTFLSLSILRRGQARDYIYCALCLGVATSFKYNAVLVCVPMLIAHFYSPTPKLSKLFLSVAATIVACFILNPFMFIDFSFFWNEIHAQGSSEGAVGLLHHIRSSLAGACGWPMLLCVIPGAYFLYRQDRKAAIVLASFPIVFFAVLTVFSQHHERYVLPIVPFVCFFAAYFIHSLAQKMTNKNFVTFIICLVLILPVLKILQVDTLMTVPDTRDQAREWVERNLPNQSAIAFSHTFQKPNLKRSQAQWDQMKRSGIYSAAQISKQDKYFFYQSKNEGRTYALYFLTEEPGGSAGFVNASPSMVYDKNKLSALGIHYVCIHYLSRGEQHAYYDDIHKNGKLIARFSPYKDADKQYSLDGNAVTVAALSFKELSSRKSLGPMLEIYQIS